MRHILSVAAISVLVSGSGCVMAEMFPGSSCGGCHGKGHAPRFGAAGTVFDSPSASDGRQDVGIGITDARGRSVHLTSNGAGNFYTEEDLLPPLQVSVTHGGVTTEMQDAPSGDCNSCHSDEHTPGPLHTR